MHIDMADYVYVLRHGRTRYSASHTVNGQPHSPISLDKVGQDQCRDLATAAWLDYITSCVTSEFPRARETADLLLAGRVAHRVIEPRLNEIDYGAFEGGPWLRYGAWLGTDGRHAVPPGGHESRDNAVRRMLDGLRASLHKPGPCLVVAHGLLLSMLTHLAAYLPIDGLALPEAPYVTPLIFAARQLDATIERGLTELEPSSRIRSGGTSTGRYAVQVPPNPDMEP